MFKIYIYHKNGMDYIGESNSLDRAGSIAQTRSLMDGISEVLIYNEQGAMVEVWVNGSEVNLQEYMDKDFEQDYEDDCNEIGYNAFIGCIDFDL